MSTEAPMASTAGPTEPAALDVVAPRKRSRAWVEALALPMAWLVIIVAFSALAPQTFPTWTNVSSLLASQAVLVVITLALIIPLTTGDFDLSVAAVAGLSAVVAAQLNAVMHYPLWISLIAAIVVGLIVGLVNALFIVVFGVESLIITLGMGTFITGITLWITDSRVITGVEKVVTEWVISKRMLGIPLSFWYALVLTAIVWYVFTYTPMGQRMLVVGRNRDVARLAGIRVSLVRAGALIAASLMAAVAGVLLLGTTGSASPSTALDYLLPAFAAAFLGSTTIKPGRFNAWGTMIAVYFLVTGITGLQLLGAKSFVQYLFYGGALILAVTFSQFVKRSRAKSGI
ncbi:unannotated protein [freshwater metagenome]|uniref:Unannotated protein n=1 Tax=freshwater metagenome TaxID=449393 RepID=A0A6J7PYK2_9ZZZZ